MAACAQGAEPTPSKPNIVFILSDDHGYADTGFNGSTEIKTPELDKLAASGTVLTSHYVQPVCSPTRACLMTGRHVTRTGVYWVVRPNAKWGLPLAERTLPQALREAGYVTAICGKWHLGEFQPQYRPTQRGFDHQYGHWFGALDYFTHKRNGQHDWHRNDEPNHDKGYTTHLIAKEACRIIRDKPADKPLFLYVPFNAVHDPHQVPPKYLEPFAELTGQRRTYAGMVAALDEAVGQIAAALKEKGLLDNTIIVFSSDNGGPKVTSNGPLRAGKGTIYEGGIRGCAFVSWPGRIPAGKKSDEPMHIVDWYPRLLNQAGLSPKQALPIDGRDVMPMLSKNEKTPHDTLFLPGMAAGQGAIRMGDWKLLVKASLSRKNVNQAPPGVETHSVELYNLASDLGEKQNVAAENPQIVKQLEAKLAEYFKDAVPPGDTP